MTTAKTIATQINRRLRIYWDDQDPACAGWAYYTTHTGDPGLDCSGPIDDEGDLDRLLADVPADQITVYHRGREDRTEDLDYLRRQLGGA